MGSGGSNKCLEDLSQFLKLCESLGVYCFPSTSLTIYGFNVNSIRNCLNKNFKHKEITLKKLQSLIWLLNFTRLVVFPGRAFLRRWIDLTVKVNNIKITSETRADMAAWMCFIDCFNGKSVFMSRKWLSLDHMQLFTDAAGSLDYAAMFGDDCFANA